MLRSGQRPFRCPGATYSVHFDDYEEQVPNPRTQLLTPSYHCGAHGLRLSHHRLLVAHCYGIAGTDRLLSLKWLQTLVVVCVKVELLLGMCRVVVWTCSHGRLVVAAM